MRLKITESDGYKYSKQSGDRNKIHIDKLTGYNSIFSNKICHGTLVISKILKLNNIKNLISTKKSFNINFNFIDYIEYNKFFYLKKKKNNFFLIQGNKEKIVFNINSKNNLEELIFKKKNFQIKKKLKKQINKNLIFFLLKIISSYVGNKYPGKNSLISSVNIAFNAENALKKEELLIFSKKIDKRFPIIKNILLYKNFKIFFETLERPIIKKNKFICNSNFKSNIKKYNNNVLIIGASSGLGMDIFKYFKKNKKIIKIVTYNENKIKDKSKNTFVYKINVFLNKKKLNHIINKFAPLHIYYFATTKILFDKVVSKKKFIEYKKMFIELPLNILQTNKDKIVSFFYPSTTNIYEDKNAIYSKIKKTAEIKLLKFCQKNKINFKSHRFPALNSKQSVSLLNPNPQSLFDYLNNSPDIFNKIF